MTNISEKDVGVLLIKWTAAILAVLMAVAVGVVAGLLANNVLEWSEIVGFTDWLSKATAFGAAFAGLAALTAAWLAYQGVRQTIRSTEVREQEKARHERFTAIVSQLGSEQATVRLGGLSAVSALADEWEREVRRLIRESPSGRRWDAHEQAWVAAVDRLAETHKEVAELRAANAAPSPEKQEEWKRRIKEAEDAVEEPRRRYTLTRDVVPLVAKDAVTQRDSCLELVTAYLRDAPRLLGPRAPGVMEQDKGLRETPENLEDQHLPVPSSGVLADNDAAARSKAVEIIRQRTAVDSHYPWPTQLLDLSGADVEHIDLFKAELQCANLSRSDLRQANLSGSDLRGAKLSESNFRETNLSESNLREADLSESNFREADLSKSNLRRANLSESNFREANLSESNFREANLSESNFREANLSESNFREADLSESDLRGANLSESDLENALLVSARLDGADLGGTNFINASLGTQKKSEIVVLASVTIDGEVVCARWNQATRWPEGFDPVRVAARQLEQARSEREEDVSGC